MPLRAAEAESHMLYSATTAPSADRRWWGTILTGIGGPSLGSVDAAVTAGWKGWLRIDREDVPGFPAGLSAVSALAQRTARQAVSDEAGWTAESAWGGFVFRE